MKWIKTDITNGDNKMEDNSKTEKFGPFFFKRMKYDRISEDDLDPNYVYDLCSEYRTIDEQKKVIKSFSVDARMKEIKIGVKTKCAYCDKNSDISLEYIKKDSMFLFCCGSCHKQLYISYNNGVDIIIFMVAGLRSHSMKGI
jgi:hypothetical protein